MNNSSNFDQLHHTKELIHNRTGTIQRWTDREEIEKLKEAVGIKDFNKLFHFKENWDSFDSSIPVSYLHFFDITTHDIKHLIKKDKDRTKEYLKRKLSEGTPLAEEYSYYARPVGVSGKFDTPKSRYEVVDWFYSEFDLREKVQALSVDFGVYRMLFSKGKCNVIYPFPYCSVRDDVIRIGIS